MAMGPLMLMRAAAGPSSSFDLIGLSIGGGLSLSFVALALHFFGILLHASSAIKNRINS